MILCSRCNEWWPEDPAHPGFPDVHECGTGMSKVMNTDEIVNKLAPTIARAIDEAVEKHGAFTADLNRGVNILTEEVGELATAVLGVTKRPTPYHTEEELFTEAVHVIAVAAMMIINISSGVPVQEMPGGDSSVKH